MTVMVLGPELLVPVEWTLNAHVVHASAPDEPSVAPFFPFAVALDAPRRRVPPMFCATLRRPFEHTPALSLRDCLMTPADVDDPASNQGVFLNELRLL